MTDSPTFWAAGLAGTPGPAHAFFDAAAHCEPALPAEQTLAVAITHLWRDPRPEAPVVNEHYAFHLLSPGGTHTTLPERGEIHHQWIDTVTREYRLAHALRICAQAVRQLPDCPTPHTTTALVSRTGIAVIGDGCGALLLAPFLSTSAHNQIAQISLMHALGEHLRALPRTEPSCPYPVFPLARFGQP